MRLTTILGLLLSSIIVVISIATQGGITRVITFFDFGSVLLVFGCSIASLITNYTFGELWVALKGTKYVFYAKPMPPEKILDLLVKMAIKARREGFLSLREEVPKEKIPLLNLGIGLIADGTDPDVTREILETAASSETSQISIIEMLWRDLSVYGPMFGMLGTLIGLVVMLRSLSDPAAIGPAMSLALITTFYGVIIAGIIALPIAGKLRNYNERLSALRVLIIEGLLSIQAGDNSHIVEEKLRARLIKR